jgi:tetratricopeptide (TPR) repeat protein
MSYNSKEFIANIEAGAELDGKIVAITLGDTRVAARISYDRGDFSQCIDYLSKDYELMVNECKYLGVFEDLIMYAQALSEEDEHAEAINSLKVIFDSDLVNAKTLQVVGYVFRRINKYEEALQYLQASNEIDDSDAETWNNLGLVYKDLDQHESAILCYERALELDPREIKAMSNLARYKGMGGDLVTARKLLERALSIDPLSQVLISNMKMVEMMELRNL